MAYAPREAQDLEEVPQAVWLADIVRDACNRRTFRSDLAEGTLDAVQCIMNAAEVLSRVCDQGTSSSSHKTCAGSFIYPL